MAFRKSLALKAFVSVAVTTTLIASFFSVSQPALAQSEEGGRADAATPKSVYYYRDPDTGVKYEIFFEPTQTEILKKFSPSRTEQMIANTQAHHKAMLRGGFQTGVAQLITTFPWEWMVFETAMAMTNGFHSQNDPGWVKTIVDREVSATGIGGFFGFLAGTRSAMAFYQAMGLAYDRRRAPVIVEKRLQTPAQARFQAPIMSPADALRGNGYKAEWKPITADVVRPADPTRLQKIFAPAVGPMTLPAGLAVSNIIAELAADPNIKLCNEGRNSKELPSIAMKEACDKAWEDWAIKKKLLDYAPDWAAMVGVGLLQGFVIKPLIAAGVNAVRKGHTAAIKKAGIEVAETLTGVTAKAVKTGSEKYIPIVIKSVNFGKALSKIAGGPAWRFAAQVGHLVMFMEILHPLSPLVKTPWETWRQGDDITKRITDLSDEIDRLRINGWVWKKSEANRSDCYGGPMGYTGASFVPNSDCTDVQIGSIPPDKLLKELAEKQSKWRQFLLTDASTAHENWKKYVASFTTMYSNSYATYQYLAQQVNFSRLDPRAAEKPSAIDRAEPLGGVNLATDIYHTEAFKSVAFALKWIREFVEEAKRSGRGLRGVEVTAIPEVIAGLQAYSPEIPIDKITSEYKKQDISKLSNDDRILLEYSYRRPYLEKALNKVAEILAKDPLHNDNGYVYGSDEYKKMAERNPFMHLKLLMDSPELLGPGPRMARTWLAEYLRTRSLAKGSLFPTEAKVLPKILTTLYADDESIPIEKFAPHILHDRNYVEMDADDRNKAEWKIREAVLAEGIAALTDVLNKDPKFADVKYTPGTEAYTNITSWNPFAKLRLLLGNALATPPGVTMIQTLNDMPLWIEQSTKTEFPKIVRNARASTMAEYLLISAVCGPEADVQLSDNDKLQIYYQSQTPGARTNFPDNNRIGDPGANDPQVVFAVDQWRLKRANPGNIGFIPEPGNDALAYQWKSWAAYFRPPRLIDAKIKTDFCRLPPVGATSHLYDYNVLKSKFAVGGVTYNGFIDVLKKHMRTDVVGTAPFPDKPEKDFEVPFDKWWTKNVEPAAKSMVKGFLKDYERIVTELFLPVMVKSGPEAEKKYNDHSFKLGVLAALEDETAFYLTTLGKSLKLGFKEYGTEAAALAKAFKNFGGIVKRVDLVKADLAIGHEAYSKLRLPVEQGIDALEKKIEQREPVIKATADVKAVNKQIIKNLRAQMGEIDSYWAIVRALHLETAKKPAPTPTPPAKEPAPTPTPPAKEPAKN